LHWAKLLLAACSVGVGHLDELDDAVDTADTTSTLDVDADESLVAPAGGPGVLHLPVVVQALFVGEKAA